MGQMKNLKQIRKEAGITQEELARRLGVIQATVAHWETGRASPNVKHLVELATILNCTMDQLIS